jgi:hypothetical protein
MKKVNKPLSGLIRNNKEKTQIKHEEWAKEHHYSWTEKVIRNYFEQLHVLNLTALMK